ncbi:esterase-like activity of phytase family protein [Rhodanobacter aciditrophus]|uniref:Esterase-like activity of phytase family protein n=1 Tax=Rhodanobacter aciditrophus TaxID=1623218 RepID=A0ABW4AXS5_9GAMM
MLRNVCMITLIGLSSFASATEATKFTAVLKEHAQLPANTFVLPPDSAPSYFNHSGRFTAKDNQRVEQNYHIYQPATGLALPFPGQPIQGFSGIRAIDHDHYLVLTDNGFGRAINSADALLMFHKVQVDWDTGRVNVQETIFLTDPDRKVPFPITDETSPARFLTGADFDPESIQPTEDGYWIGDEFGPWLIHVDNKGVVQDVIATHVNGTHYASPDNPFLLMPNPNEKSPDVITMRSGGFEGMAISADKKTLYPLLEKPIYDVTAGKPETVNGQPVLRMLSFDLDNKTWGDQVLYYPLENPRHAIGDFNMIDDHRALIIERDNGTGDPRENWSKNPARFKRVYLVDLDQVNDQGVIRKLAYIDLMDIQDPNKVAIRGTIDGIFTFPFFTIENVDRIDEHHIVIANDNNYPFSVGREQGRVDDNEIIVLDVRDFLQAK